MRLPEVTSRALLLAFVVASVWTVLVFAVPFTVPEGELVDLSGRVGGHENEPEFEDLNPVAHAVYWAGDAECHQISNRSYYLNDNQMPFCARDVGLFIGLMGGFGLAAFHRLRVKPWYFLLMIVPLVLDGGLQAVSSYESNNPLRLATGIAAGIGLALLLSEFVMVLREDARKAKQTEAG